MTNIFQQHDGKLDWKLSQQINQSIKGGKKVAVYPYRFHNLRKDSQGGERKNRIICWTGLK